MQENRYLEITYSQDRKSQYPYQLTKYLMTKYLNGVISEEGSYKQLLDLGCGWGEYTNAFSLLGYKTIGIDKYNTGIDFEKNSLLYKDNIYDIVFSKSVIEHLVTPELFLTEIYRVLKPKGQVIIMTPDWETCWKSFYIDYTHKQPYTLKSLRELLLIFNFKNVSVEKFYQLPLLWKYPYLTFLAKLTNLLPNSFKWKDKEQTNQNTWIRFSKELMLVGIGEK